MLEAMAGVCHCHGDDFSSCQSSFHFSMNSYLLTIHQQLLGFSNADWVTRDSYSPLDRRNLHLAGSNQEEHFVSTISNRNCSETSSRSRLNFSHRSKPPARYSEALVNDSDGTFGYLNCCSPLEPNFLVQVS